MRDDTLELREELLEAWQAVMRGAVERGYPQQAVLETMASCAHQQFSMVFGASAAASYLQLLAAELRGAAHDATVSLVRGSECEADDDQAFDLEWQEDPSPF